MKKLVFILLVASWVAGCKNSNSGEQGQSTNLATELKIEPAQIKEAQTKSQTTMQHMDDLRKDIEAVEPTLTEAQKVELEEIRHYIDDIQTKEEMRAKALDAAAQGGKDPNNPVPTPGVLADHVQSAGDYEKDLAELRKRLEALKSGQK